MFRATKLIGYIRAMEKRGIAVSQLLAGSRISERCITESEYQISLKQYRCVVTNMMRLTNDPGIAFSLGDAVRLNDFGIYGYAMISATSVRTALDVMHKYATPFAATQLHVERIASVAPGYEIVFSTTPEIDGTLRRFETEELIATGVRIIQELTGVNPVFGHLSFAYPEPAHRALYQRILKYPMQFDASRTVIRILEPDLDTPIRTSNDEMFRICAEHCRHVTGALPNASGVISRLRELFLNAPASLPSLEDASMSLGISASTLIRQLAESETSYQSLKNEFRFSLAAEYFREGRISPKQVGYLLGYADQSNFHRSFKRWSGRTVRQFLRDAS